MQLGDKPSGIDLLGNRRQDDELEPAIRLEPGAQRGLDVRMVERPSSPAHEPGESLGRIPVDLAEHGTGTTPVQRACRVLEQPATEAPVARGRRDDHVRDEAALALRVQLVGDATDDVVTVQRDARMKVIAARIEPRLERLAVRGERIEIESTVESLEQNAIGLYDRQMSSSGGGVGWPPLWRSAVAR